MVADAYNPSTWEDERIEFQASLGYLVSSRPAWAAQQAPESNKLQNQNKQEKYCAEDFHSASSSNFTFITS
jgi:hypothetical protein